MNGAISQTTGSLQFLLRTRTRSNRIHGRSEPFPVVGKSRPQITWVFPSSFQTFPLSVPQQTSFALPNGKTHSCISPNYYISLCAYNCSANLCSPDRSYRESQRHQSPATVLLQVVLLREHSAMACSQHLQGNFRVTMTTHGSELHTQEGVLIQPPRQSWRSGSVSNGGNNQFPTESTCPTLVAQVCTALRKSFLERALQCAAQFRQLVICKAET